MLYRKKSGRAVCNPDSAYIFDDELALAAMERRQRYLLPADRWPQLLHDRHQSGHRFRARALGLLILPPYTMGTEFRADLAAPASIHMRGWETARAPAIWTVGRLAAIDIRPVLPRRGDLRLELEFGGNGALLTASRPVQRTVVMVDGQPVGSLEFFFGGANRFRRLVIPRRLVRDGHVVEIGFRLPDAAAPRDLGINGDARLLGIYVSRIRLVGND